MRIEENIGKQEPLRTRRNFLGLGMTGAGLVVAGEIVRRSSLFVPSEQPIELVSFQTSPETIVDPEYPHLSFNNEAAHVDFDNPALNPLLKRLMTKTQHDLLIDCIHAGHTKYEKRYHPTDPLKISDHFTWNAIDIGEVDGELVRPTSEKSRSYVEALLALPKSDPRKPTRIISPWGDLTETNVDHQTHIHVANTKRQASTAPKPTVSPRR